MTAIQAEAALASKVRRTACAAGVTEIEPTKVAKAFSRSAIPMIVPMMM
jgi:hypothetical protein